MNSLISGLACCKESDVVVSRTLSAVLCFSGMVWCACARTSRHMQGRGHLPFGSSKGGVGWGRGRHEWQTLRGSVSVPSTSVPAGEGWDHSSVLGQSRQKNPAPRSLPRIPNSRGIPPPLAPLERARGVFSCDPMANGTDKGRQGCTHRTAQAYCRDYAWAFFFA
jgi:hypothetical protein